MVPFQMCDRTSKIVNMADLGEFPLLATSQQIRLYRDLGVIANREIDGSSIDSA